ncbi:MAG: prolipoprotein diacylglyceryl transferase [Steroidobacteraceae bacterium]
MLTYPHINPVLISIGPVAVRWYGLMFVAAFAGPWWLARRRAVQPDSTWSLKDVDDLVFFGAVGAIVGGRLAGCCSTDSNMNWSIRCGSCESGRAACPSTAGSAGQFSPSPCSLDVAAGGLLMSLTLPPRCPRSDCSQLRVANFINGELWGKPANVPWAFMVNGVPRHASQLYEAVLEGIVLGTIIWVFTARPRPRLAPSGLFLVGYGLIRFAIEFVRLPDDNRGYLLLGVGDRGAVAVDADDRRRLHTSGHCVQGNVPSGNVVAPAPVGH